MYFATINQSINVTGEMLNMFKNFITTVRNLLTGKATKAKEEIKQTGYILPPVEQMVLNPWTQDLPETAILGVCVCMTVQRYMYGDNHTLNTVSSFSYSLSNVKTEAEVFSVLSSSAGQDIVKIIEKYQSLSTKQDRYDLVSIFSPLLSKYDDYTFDLRIGDKDFDEKAEKSKKALTATQKNAESQLEMLKDLISEATGLQKKTRYLKENLLVKYGVLDLTDKKFSNFNQNGIVTIINEQLKLSSLFNAEINSIKLDKKHSEGNSFSTSLTLANDKSITFDFV